MQGGGQISSLPAPYRQFPRYCANYS